MRQMAACTLAAFLLAPATLIAQGHGKSGKATDDHHPKADAKAAKAKTEHGKSSRADSDHDDHAPRSKAAGHDARGDDGRPKHRAAHDETGTKRARPAPGGARDGPGTTQGPRHGAAHDDRATPAKRSAAEEPKPMVRARMVDAPPTDGHGAQESPDAARRPRQASRAELEVVTERIRNTIRERPQARRSTESRSGAVAAAKPQAHTRLTWRPALSWPPALDGGPDPHVSADGGVQLNWDLNERCATPEPSKPDIPSTTWSTMAGLAPNRCCGLFLSK